MKTEELKKVFFQKYGNESKRADLFFSPGRVNLIGEHTDYNGGYVFPCALDFGTKLMIRKNDNNKFRFSTTNFDDESEIPVNIKLEKKNNHWYNYPMGVIDQYNQRGIN
ncbi:MAG: galactokinase family protein, partial [Bacteroidota bacterium]